MSDFELIRDTLMQFDPETRHHVIEAMKVLRGMPVPVAVRILADAVPDPQRPLITFSC